MPHMLSSSFVLERSSSLCLGLPQLNKLDVGNEKQRRSGETSGKDRRSQLSNKYNKIANQTYHVAYDKLHLCIDTSAPLRKN